MTLKNNAIYHIQRFTEVDALGVPVGHHLPLRDCKDDIIDVIIKLSKIRCPLKCGQAIHLINDLIERLFEWNMLHEVDQPLDKLKKVGNSYGYACLQRHEDRINTKKGISSNWIDPIGLDIGIFFICMEM
jgi:hypothetical protein